jgi:bacterial/archaeal transporter family protein
MTWPFYALLSAIFAALVAIFGKIGLARIDPILGAAVRGVIMAAFMIGAVVALKKFDPAVFVSTPREWLFIVLAAAAGALSWLFYFVALRTGTASGVSAIDRLSIVIVILLAAFALGEKLTWIKFLGGSLIVAGAILVAW